MKWNRHGRTAPGQPSALPRLLLLALFFLGGVILGQVLAGRVPAAAGEELERYLSDYVGLDRGELSAGTVFPALVLYLRYPLLAFLLGVASVGVALLPLATAAFGFFLSFSVCCFTAAFGADGVLLALSVFGLRCLVTLPCYFLLAVPAWGTAAALARASFGRGRRAAPVSFGRGYWLRAAAVLVALLAGVCLELFASPWLLRLTLARVLP